MLAHVERVQVRVRLLWPAISGLVSRRCSWRLTLALTLTLTQVLVAYDRNSDGLLSLAEFGELVHRMQGSAAMLTDPAQHGARHRQQP